MEDSRLIRFRSLRFLNAFIFAVASRSGQSFCGGTQKNLHAQICLLALFQNLELPVVVTLASGLIGFCMVR